MLQQQQEVCKCCVVLKRNKNENAGKLCARNEEDFQEGNCYKENNSLVATPLFSWTRVQNASLRFFFFFFFGLFDCVTSLRWNFINGDMFVFGGDKIQNIYNILAAGCAHLLKKEGSITFRRRDIQGENLYPILLLRVHGS